MKIIKPLRLGMLTRPFANDGRHWLAVTAIAMTDRLGSDARLIPEQECWKIFGEEVGIDGAFDLGMPKLHPEFLVTGAAYTRQQQDKTQCAVRVRVGGRQKDLLVFGDRFWIDGRPSAPQPYESMRIDWGHAFGGPGFAENPGGIGHAHEQVGGVQAQRLANIEDPRARVQRPDQTVQPAGFGPVEATRPSRADRLGRQYDEHWQNHLYPGYAKDMDWAFFNAAPPDQWFGRDDGELAGAEFELWNLHPDRTVQHGRLPDWRARAIVVRGPINSVKLDEGTLHDVPMRLTTAWFFPHLERVGLIYHGFVEVEQDDAADVTHAMIAMEEAAMPPQGLDAWRDLLVLRCESEDRALYGMRDDLLLPEPIIGAWPDLDAEFEESPMRRNVQARVDHERERMKVSFRSSGLGSAAQEEPPAVDLMEKVPTLRELPAYMAQRKALIEEHRQKIEAARRELDEAAKANAVHSRKAGFDTSNLVQQAESSTQKGPPTVDRWARIESILAQSDGRGFSPTPDQIAQLRKVHDDAASQLLENYRRTAQHQDAADKMSGEQSAQTRMEVERRMAGARDLSDMDLTGADLTGMDLRGACWHRAMLECADLSGSRLDGGDLSDALLARARLVGTSMREANLKEANLSLALCENSDFTGARFESTQLEGMAARGCRFADAFFDLHEAAGVVWENCGFERAQLRNLSFTEGSRLKGLDFEGASFHKVDWIECQAGGLRFCGATLDTCDWTDTDCTEAMNFSDARLIATCFVGSTDLRKADFQGATLVECNLQSIRLDEADFRDAKLDNTDFTDASMRGARLGGANADGSDFVRTDLTAASLVDASLIETDFSKAILVATDFHRANLFQADLSQCLIDDTTRFDEAYTVNVITVPRRKAQEVAR